MDGTGVFNFVQKEVPPAIHELLEKSGFTKDDVDYYLFHQPNKFMLQKLAEALLSKNNHCCLSGFGGGLTWASIIMDIGYLDFCENIISNL